MHLLPFLLTLSVLPSTFASAHPRRQTPVSNTTLSPCAQVSASYASQYPALPTITAQLGYDCLTSVALNASAATALIEAILPYVEWQTTTSYLKDPPSTYLVPGVDLNAEFQNVLTNITAGAYANEHEFQADLFRVFNLAHDGHFRFMPDLLSKAIVFARPVSLVSVSLDGVEIPKVYATSDIQNYNLNGGGNSSAPSAVSQINGENATEFLTELAMLGQGQDPDALWNNLFYELAFNAQVGGGYEGYFAGSGRYGSIYPGDNTTVGYENGTEIVYENYAIVIGNFTGVDDGESFFEKFCTGPHLVPYASNVSYPFPTPPPLPPTATIPAYAYPTPVVISSDDQVSGYFLDEDTGYEDVAVLSMLSFEANFPVEFQSGVQTFIADARTAGKTKMVIDLSGNGGGTILIGYDTFRQFFPSIVQDGFTRFREHEAFDILSEQLSIYSAGFDVATADDEQIFAYESVPDYHYDLNETDQNFLTYADKFAPQAWNGDSFTNILRWNLSDPLTTTNTTWGVGEEITGYMDRTNFTQPFAAEDIIIVYDGYCASTCTLFSEFMRLQAGVRSIAFGGRPNTDIIQAIGGVKGANNYPYSYIETLAGVPLGNASPDQVANWTSLTAYTDLPTNRSTDNSLNVRDHILRPNLVDGIPAQFVYEAADCRVFYEPSMISDVTAIWKRAADAAWGGKACVAGSLPSNETVTVRRRKSEEMKIKASSDRRPKFDKRWLRSTQWTKVSKSPIHGQKIPL